MSKEKALDYHRYPTPGKISITPTKTMVTQHDLSMAYSPGVAYACEAIVEDPMESYNLTSKGNLVAVITNGTAVLGLGDIGPDAAKPVMEGKGVLFKRFAGVDVFDIEINEKDPNKLVDIIASLAPTFGGINLEDIAAPHCFFVEKELQKRLNIPVFHDDQHGTAIIATAALINALKIVNKKIEDVKIVTSGAGAAAIACLNLFIEMGAKRENIIVADRTGVITTSRPDIQNDPIKSKFAQDVNYSTLEDAFKDADVFLGLSAAGSVNKTMVTNMAANPIIMAMANPTPEILPEDVKEVRGDAIIATGRSDYPNQVNNVLCFPYIFKGALDVNATEINKDMQIACVRAVAALAQIETSEAVMAAYGGAPLSFGREYILPKPFDPRLLMHIAPAVAEAAMRTGVARKKIEDMEKYKAQLMNFTYRSGYVMRPVMIKARQVERKVIFSNGAHSQVLLAVQQISDEKLCFPILIGSKNIISERIKELRLRIEEGTHFEIIDFSTDPRLKEFGQELHQIIGRQGTTPEEADYIMRTDNTTAGAMLLHKKIGDALICGPSGHYDEHLEKLQNILGLEKNVSSPSSVDILMTEHHTVFISDSNVVQNPSAEQIVCSTLLASKAMHNFGIEPKVALLSHSNFGSDQQSESAKKMRQALKIIRENHPSIVIDGEMTADCALSEKVRARVLKETCFEGAANLLIAPSLESANIASNMVTMMGDALKIGPILLGLAKPVHIASRSSTVRSLVNLASIAAAQVSNE